MDLSGSAASEKGKFLLTTVGAVNLVFMLALELFCWACAFLVNQTEFCFCRG